MSELITEKIRDTLYILEYFRALCTFPLSYSERAKRFVKLGKLNVYYLICSIAIYTSFCYTIYYLVASVEESTLKVWTSVIIKIIRVLMGIRNVMICFNKRSNVVTFLNWLVKFDTQLFEEDVIMDFRMIKYLMIIRSFFITATVTVNPVVCTLSRNDMAICFEHFISYNLTFIINSMIMLQFSVYIFILWQRLRTINNSITNMVTNGSLNSQKQKYPPIMFKQDEKAKLLRLLCTMHNEICNNAKLLNDIYSEVILLTIIKTFADILNGLHTLISKTELILIIFDFSWGVALLIEVIFILIPCTSTKRASQRTAEILNMLDVSDNKSLKFEREMFLLQMMHQKIKFTANDYFPLDESVFIMIFGTSASYLIILMQFESISI